MKHLRTIRPVKSDGMKEEELAIVALIVTEIITAISIVYCFS